KAKDLQIDAMMNAVQKHAPWAYFGFSTQLEGAWHKQRVQLIAAVDARRANPET
ncbi:MAG: hypothetical protein H7Y11_11855, partial [Armatimonadetes bacterium]|nr:hypothetical protein [Anaerolineae bacterium]